MEKRENRYTRKRVVVCNMPKLPTSMQSISPFSKLVNRFGKIKEPSYTNGSDKGSLKMSFNKMYSEVSKQRTF